MTNVNDVFITKEVSDKLDLSPAYLIRLAKKLQDEGLISNVDMRSAGKRNYIFSTEALEVIKNNLKRK
ncbi:AraC family transcriptional regulator [Clostridium sp. M14]|uniref:AraC family transcriptional regulator n=1 Tax=Clostridium sp. M14 TaxID=2716311 RepID=UPI0013EEAD08|nr:AraC family transcriptional regulator [Clostridium sp. M14]MBZ9693202.1 AraC family transcriptional regulator [Clostridium sp. M14]